MRPSLITAPALVLAAAFVIAGPLTPPPGPVSGSYRTLAEVEPRTPVQSLAAAPPYLINQPGSYYLTGNITAVAGQRGITITADNVTVDLNGFAMIGNLNGDDAIYLNNRRNITVRNGLIRDWNKEGLDGFGANNVHVENITVDNSANGYGIILGDGARVLNSSVSRSAAGFIVGVKAALIGCTADANNGLGFAAGLSADLQNCTADGNLTDGFSVGAASNLRACIARAIAGNGCTIDGWAILADSTAVGNTLNGVNVIAPGSGATNGASILNCNISANALTGINHFGSGATIRGCTFSRNTGGAIGFGSGCNILDNTFQENGTTVGDPPLALQIATNGSGNRIDGNHFSTGAGITAMWLMGVDNLVVRNTFVGPGAVTDSLTNANNEIAAIIVSPGQNFSSTNAWANFRY